MLILYVSCVFDKVNLYCSNMENARHIEIRQVCISNVHLRHSLSRIAILIIHCIKLAESFTNTMQLQNVCLKMFHSQLNASIQHKLTQKLCLIKYVIYLKIIMAELCQALKCRKFSVTIIK